MPEIPRPVRLLGWSSLCNAGALSLGIIEGVAEAVNSVLKIGSGYVSDRWTQQRPIVIAGHLLSTSARPLAIVGPLIASVLLWYAPGESRLVFVRGLRLAPARPRGGAASASVLGRTDADRDAKIDSSNVSNSRHQ